jgi:hypothetical protein
MGSKTSREATKAFAESEPAMLHPRVGWGWVLIKKKECERPSGDTLSQMGASNEYLTCTMSRYSAAMFSWKKGGEPDSLEGQE